MQKALLKRLGAFFNTRAAGAYLLIFAAAIGIATFVENDFGRSAAQKLIYNTWWFELLLALFSVTLLVNIKRYRFIQQKKWALLLFHFAMVIILIGAGVTRYFGYEGRMHIREGGSSNYFLSDDTYLNFTIEHEGQRYEINEPVLFAGVGNNEFHESYRVGTSLVEVELNGVIPNPKSSVREVDNGQPMLKVVFGSASGRQEYYLKEGDKRTIGGVDFNLTSEYIPRSFQVIFKENTPFFRADETYVQTVMATQTTDTLAASNEFRELQLRALYSNGHSGFVFGEFIPSGSIGLTSESPKITSSSQLALDINVTIDGHSENQMVYGIKGGRGRAVDYVHNQTRVAVSYGSKPIVLPFRIRLKEFIMERYPGTNSPASYASEVILIDDIAGLQTDFRIFMNNILNYKGHRFFQSSYDRDEKGTYLSVNHDYWGTLISYIGYALLTLGLIMTFFSKKTRFSKLIQSIKKMNQAGTTILVIAGSLFSVVQVEAQTEIAPTVQIISKSHAELFSTVMVQDRHGRVKPMHTLNRELMRKVHRSEQLGEWNADQVVLSMYADKSSWLGYPLISLGKHEGIAKALGVTGKKASYKDFFHTNGEYKLRSEMSRVSNMEQADWGVYEKQLAKVDERVNIMNMIFSGSLFSIIPVPNHQNNKWISERAHGSPEIDRTLANKFFSGYRKSLHDVLEHGDETDANEILTELKVYQRKVGKEIMPSDGQISAEMFLNNSKIFNRLAPINAILGLGFLALLFISVFAPNLNLRWAFMGLISIAVIGFLFYTLGLGMRWYVSGRAPWSNGYESMIYIGWTASLAGFIFARKLAGGMAATMVLSAVVLSVAMLSFLDPEITPLVPVLKSYWLTIHVSLEAGSYGFLLLGAIIGLINLLLMATLIKRNIPQVKRVVKELSFLSELILTAGLVMISIGTYLGGVWANESWGRYWGWDPKETWALVSILVYAFILHMRLIPGLRGFFTYNFATLFGLSSIIMTYFGVNYYLSGLHSYAAGDPIPIPSWVLIAVISLLVLSAIAYWQQRRMKLFGK